MKKFYCSLVMLILGMVSLTTPAQLAVIDGAAIATTVSHQAANIAKFTAQVDLLTNQLTQLQNEYKSITGIRGFGDLLKNESFQDNLPDDWEFIYDQVRNKGYAGLNPAAKKIYDKTKIYDSCRYLKSSDEKQLCEAHAVKTAQDLAFVNDALEKSNTRLTTIRKLLDEVKNTQDPKGIAELQARITSEQNIIANDQAKWALFKMAQEAEDKIHYQRESEAIAKDAAKRGGIEVQPLTFD